VTLRSILLGLLGVVFICGLAPYNDWAVSNTFMIGNFLPIGLVLVLLVLVLLVNGLLRAVAPTHMIREAELAVITAMLLASCSLPSSGLMRYLPSSIVGIHTTAADKVELSKVVQDARIPSWLLPDMPDSADTPNAKANTDVMKYYLSRSPDQVVPWSAWVRPILSWGIFVAMLWGIMILLCLLVRRQWAENERLAFPLATVYGSLIEAPEPGRWFNTLFSSRGFWIAAAAVFGLHAFNGFHAYFPIVPEIPRGYNFNQLFADPPFGVTRTGFKAAQLYFCVIGITFFLQSKIAFSIWFFFVLVNLTHVIVEGQFQATFTDPMKHDQTFGAMVMLSMVILWIGRQHWWMIIRKMFGQSRQDETESRYLPYAFAGWGVVVLFVGIVIWMTMAGMAWYGAILMTVILLMMLMTVARIVAETGLVFVQINWPMSRVWFYPAMIPDTPVKTDATTFFFSGWLTTLFHDLRESFAAFFLTGVRVADTAAYERSRRWKTGVSFLLAVILALVVGYFVAAGSMLWTEYNYASTMSSRVDSPINRYGVEYSPRDHILSPADNYANGPREEGHSSLVHISIGGAVVAACSVLRLTLAWWPLHPIGYFVSYAYAIDRIWFSVMIGWLAKVIIVRFGGSELLKSGRNVFIGLVVGETSAAAFWLIYSLLANWLGYDYQRIILLPT
jgi:hypothetical protein